MRPRHGRKHSRQASVDFPKYLPINSPTQLDVMPSTTLAPVIPSDYDSDNQGYISDYPTVKAPVARTREELNLAVLKHINTDITAILSIAPFVTLYDWAPGDEPGSESGWQKTPTVGSLFICQLRPGEYGEERYQALLLNRGGDKNFTAELRQSEESSIEIQGDFIIVMRQDKGKPMELNALFIYAAEGTSTAASRTANGELMVALAEASKRSRLAAENNTIQRESQPQSAKAMDISQLQALFSHSPAKEQTTIEQPPAPKAAQSIDLLALLQGGTLNASQAQPVQPPQAVQTPIEYQQRQVHPLPPKPPVTKDDPLRASLLNAFLSPKPPPTPAQQTNEVSELFRKAGLLG